MNIPVEVVVAVLAGSLAIAGTIITQRMARKAQGDQHRQDRLEWALERLDKVEGRERLLLDYIIVLRGDLEEAGVRVRSWPEGLTSGG